ncbi:MAG: Hsp20/alpha crystallin family protein [Candidatus Pacebacteria bacterium]|nr:Hsp20/alpha crystallin family protein [Candidatus Paceibacterota bacterium]
MSFLQRLKGRGARAGQRLQSSEEESAVDTIAQLEVDVFQTTDLIVVYAHAAGADLSDIHVSIEGDADIVLIEGKRLRPEYLAFPKKKPDGAYFTEECVWGEFYRRIILPESVDITQAEAKVKNGVLVLVLPLLKPEVKEKVNLRVKKAKSKRSRKK